MQNKWRSAFKGRMVPSGVFLRHQQWKELLIFISFLLLAFIFWFLQTLQQEYEQRIELPVHYRNIPADWVLSDRNPEFISVSIKEKGSLLLYYLWNTRSHSIDISVSGLSPSSDTTLLITNRMLETELSKHFSASTSILSFEPREMELAYDLLSNKLLPVTAQVSIVTKPGFQISGNITVSAAEMRFFGSYKALSGLKEVKTKPVTLENVSKTTELTVPLELPEGIKPEIETVNLIIPVEEFTEKKLKLPVLCTDMPDNYALRLFPSSVEVTCYIPLSQFRELTEDKLEIALPFYVFEAYQATGKIPVRLTRKPHYVTNPVISPKELEFIIEHHD